MSGRIAVGAFVVFLVSAVGYTNIYLPYFSPEAEAGRRRTAASRGAGHKDDIAPGSVWKNISKQRDYLDGLKGEPDSSDGSASAGGAPPAKLS